MNNWNEYNPKKEKKVSFFNKILFIIYYSFSFIFFKFQLKKNTNSLTLSEYSIKK